MWHFIEMTYTADAVYNYIYVGIMGDWASLNTSMLWSTSSTVGPYFWVDEVSVVQMPSCCELDSMSQSTTNTSCGGSDGSLTVTASGVGPFVYKLFDMSGTQIDFNSNGAFNGLPTGDYWVQINGVSCDFYSDTLTPLVHMSPDL